MIFVSLPPPFHLPPVQPPPLPQQRIYHPQHQDVFDAQFGRHTRPLEVNKKRPQADKLWALVKGPALA
jgi:hypothetical protein